MQQTHIFPMIRRELDQLLNGYVQHPSMMGAGLEHFIQPPQLAGRAGILGSLVLAKTRGRQGLRMTGSLLKSTVVAALGGLLFGFDTAVIAGTTAGLTNAFHLTPSSLGLTVAIALVGTVIGALTAGFPGDRYRPARQPAHPGGDVSDLGSRLRVCLGLVFAGLLPFHRRTGDWRIFGLGADVYCRNFAGEAARPPGWLLSVQCGRWHSASLISQIT